LEQQFQATALANRGATLALFARPMSSNLRRPHPNRFVTHDFSLLIVAFCSEFSPHGLCEACFPWNHRKANLVPSPDRRPRLPQSL